MPLPAPLRLLVTLVVSLLATCALGATAAQADEYYGAEAVAPLGSGFVTAGKSWETGVVTTGRLLHGQLGRAGQPTAVLAEDSVGIRANKGHAVVAQSDGRYYVAGESRDSTGNIDMVISRHYANGTLDGTFAAGSVTSGAQLVDFSGYSDRAWAVGLQSTGKIILAGETSLSGGSADVALVRLNSDGTLDTTFGSAGTGRVRADLAGAATSDIARGMVINSADSITIGGSANSRFLVAKFNANGALSTTFGTSGSTTVRFSTGFTDFSEAKAIKAQADGSYVLAGTSKTGSTTSYAAIRVTAAGALDNTFSGDGKQIVTFPTYSGNATSGNALLIQPDGKIVVAGNTQSITGAGIVSYDRFGLTRLLANGDLDTSYGTSGVTVTAFPCNAFNFCYGSTAYDLVYAQENILVVGDAPSPTGGFEQPRAPAAALYGPNGGLIQVRTSFSSPITTHSWTTPTLTSAGDQAVSPSAGALLTSGSGITLRWQGVRSATGYDVKVDGVLAPGGSNLKKPTLPIGTLASGTHTWSVIVHQGSTSIEAPAVQFRVADATDATLANAFRPILRFDSEEPWRPLNVDLFFEENFNDGQPGTSHEICSRVTAPRVCAPMDTSDAVGHETDAWKAVTDWPAGIGQPDKDYWPVIDIHGEGDTIDNFKSPYLATCSSSGLNDCDSGPRTALYYRVSDPSPEANYRFIDYWMFYRFNKFNGGDHEADWEHIMVAIPAGTSTPATFSWVGLSAHSDNTWRYLRGALQCEANQSSCGTESIPLDKQRVNAYVANGSHAIYPRPCSFACSQISFPWVEKSHDGGSAWASNDDGSVLLPFNDGGRWVSSSEQEGWLRWPGRWRLKSSSSHVESPGVRLVYDQPWDWECTDRDSDPMVEQCPEAQGTTSRSAPSTSCEPWSGPNVVISMCNPAELAKSLQSGQLGQTMTTPQVLINDQAQSSFASHGIVQVVGKSLRYGNTIEFPDMDGSTEVRIRYRDRGREATGKVSLKGKAKRWTLVKVGKKVQLTDGAMEVAVKESQ